MIKELKMKVKIEMMVIQRMEMDVVLNEKLKRDMFV